MNLLRKIQLWLCALFQKRKLDREMDEEMRAHIELRTQQHIATGMRVDEARYAAQWQFGWVESLKEDCRGQRGVSWIENLVQDVRFSVRMLLKNPGFTGVAVLTLALGIGSTSAVFDLIQGVLLTPPPYPNPEQVVLISPQRTDGQASAQGCMGMQWTQWQRDSKSFNVMAGYNWGFAFLVLPESSESVEGMWVTPEYFQVTGLKPILGRGFLPAEAPTAMVQASVIILGEALWRRRFNSDPEIVGKTIHLGGRPPVTVVGVMPSGVRFLPTPRLAHLPNYDPNARVDFWFPASPDETKEAVWSVVGRLRDGANLQQAQAELTAIATRQAQANHDFEGITAKVQSLTEVLNREGSELLFPLLGAVILVFLIACGNVAGLLLARGLQRQQEYAVRSALGAQKTRLFRYLFTESLLLALVGGGAGLGLAIAIVRVLSVISGTAIPRVDAIAIGWRLPAFGFGCAILAAVLAGLFPALRASRTNPAQALKSGGRTISVGNAERRLLAGVIISQMALTLALLVGAGLLIRTVYNLARVRAGYETRNILTMSITQVRMNDDKEWAQRFLDFHTRALARVSTLPGVKNAAFAWGVPLTGNKWIGTAEIEGQPSTGTLKDNVSIPMRAVTPEYFDALGLRIIAGRNFRSPEAFSWPVIKTNVPYVAIINQAMAKRYFPNSNPLGKRLHFSFENIDAPAEIIGVTTDTRSETLTREDDPEIYFFYWQLPAGTKHLVLRTSSDPRSLISTIQRELRAMDPTIVIENVRTLEQVRNDSVARQIFAMRLLVGFSLVAGILSLVGIYGVLSLSVGARTKELAIRLAVGAQRWSILRLVLREGLRLIVVGLILGLSVALALGRILKSFLFGVESTDAATLLGMALLFAGIALFACWLPAVRASRLNPIEALRSE